MNDCPSYLAQLLAAQRLPKSQLPVGSRQLLKPLFDGGILESEIAGRGETVVVKNSVAFRSWLHSRFPSVGHSWSMPEGATRARALAQRRDSKAAASFVTKSALHLRALSESIGVTVDEADLSVMQLTKHFGIAACLVGSSSRLQVKGQPALVENLECFLQAEVILPDISLFLNSAGRVSDRLIACLARSDFTAPLIHLPDYDPVGLDDYLRLRAAMGPRVCLFVPTTLDALFATFGNKKLISDKPRNRALLRRLSTAHWPCADSQRVFELIKETGCGLEQEALLLG